MRGPQGVPVGTFRRVMISNLVSYNAVGKLSAIIAGIPEHLIQDVKISDVYMHHRGGGTKEMAAFQPPEFENKYPDPHMFGLELPASGFFVRHARNVEFTNVEIAYDAADERTAFILDDVQGSDFFRVKTPQTTPGRTFSLNNVSDFRTLASRGLKDLELDRADKRTL